MNSISDKLYRTIPLMYDKVYKMEYSLFQIWILCIETNNLLKQLYVMKKYEFHCELDLTDPL